MPPARIAESARDIQALLGEHGFLTGVAGHTSAGNLHFMLTPDFSKPEDLGRYETFMGKLVELILDKYDGSLKAEHGTGVNMAPYVEREWGEKATGLMWRIKELADPDGVLAPGVMLNRDPGAHLQNLKSTPEIEEIANACVECGFCEPVCPSRNLTTTPRQRIVLRREMARQPEGSPVLTALNEEYEYDGLETCAADGTCVIACPVSIDTGKLVKQLRRDQHTERQEDRALKLAERWSTVERWSRRGLRFGGPIRGVIPRLPKSLPRPAPAKLPRTSREGAAAVYMPACVNRIFGLPRGGDDVIPLPEALVAVSDRAGMPVWIPDDVAGNCCATPWDSKGYARGRESMAAKLADSLRRWSGEGKLPVVIDAASCTLGAEEIGSEVEVLDSVAWAERLLPVLEVRKTGSATVHPPCASRHLGLDRRLASLAEALAEEVNVPVSATCCGMAGDRGILHPELTASATAAEAAEVAGRDFDAHLCGNRTCEIALEDATGEPYISPVQLLEQATRPAR